MLLKSLLVLPATLASIVCSIRADSLPEQSGDAQIPSTFNFRIGASYLTPADLDGSSGRMSRAALLGELKLNLPPVTDKLFVGLFINGGALAYDFSGQTKLAPGNASPWEDIYLASIGVSAFLQLDAKWSAFAALNGNFAAEEGADFSDSLTGGGILGAGYAVSNDLSVGLSVLFQTRLDDDPIVVPIPTLTWKLPFDDQRRWTLRIGDTNAGPVIGAGAALSFEATRELTLSLALTGFGVGGEFRLADNGPIPGGVGRDFAVPLVLDANWKLNPHINIGAFAGINLFGNIEALDASGDKIADQDLDPSATFGFRVAADF